MKILSSSQSDFPTCGTCSEVHLFRGVWIQSSDARIQHLTTKYGDEQRTRYTHIALSHKTPRTTLEVLRPRGHITTTASYSHLSIGAAEAMTIAHATPPHCNDPYLTNLRDSQHACPLYLAGLASAKVLSILQKLPDDMNVTIVWAPGHSGLLGIEAAHAAALDLHIWAGNPELNETVSQRSNTY